jgi:hypothetical protein
MRRLTHAIVVAGAVLCAHTSTATVIVCDPSTTDCPSPPPTTGSLNCEGAALSQGVIWPPDHKMVPLNIIDLPSDPNLVVMPVTVQIISIQQDEPVNALGSGNTAPDGIIANSTTSGTPSIAYVRAERAGPGTGRIYFITFTLTDGSGNTCPAPVTLQVIVPHDQGQGYTPVYTGQKYDSTMSAP